MMGQPFEIPTDDEIEAVLMVKAEPGADIGVQHLQVLSGDGCQLSITTDSPGRSVTITVVSEGAQWLSTTREGATEMVVSRTPPEIAFAFGTDDTTGRLDIHLNPQLRIDDFTLLA